MARYCCSPFRWGGFSTDADLWVGLCPFTGYVAHLTFMISKYLEVPFRFPISPMCSRSHIKDDISTSTPDNPKERTYPLYSVKKERLQFDYGVFLLNKNIQQLLNHCMLQPVRAIHALERSRRTSLSVASVCTRRLATHR